MTDRTGTVYIEPNPSPVPASLQTQLDRLAERVERLELDRDIIKGRLQDIEPDPTPPPIPTPADRVVCEVDDAAVRNMRGQFPLITKDEARSVLEVAAAYWSAGADTQGEG